MPQAASCSAVHFAFFPTRNRSILSWDVLLYSKQTFWNIHLLTFSPRLSFPQSPRCGYTPCHAPDARAGLTNFTKFLIRILLSFYHAAQAPRRTLVGLYQHIPTNSVGESGPAPENSNHLSSTLIACLNWMCGWEWNPRPRARTLPSTGLLLLHECKSYCGWNSVSRKI
jgi:hypothetical protein